MHETESLTQESCVSVHTFGELFTSPSPKPREIAASSATINPALQLRSATTLACGFRITVSNPSNFSNAARFSSKYSCLS
jgi:hypothetical protein